MSSAAMDEAIRELLAALGPDLVLTDEADRISYSYDATHLSHRPDVVVFPRTTEHVQKVMAIARRHRVPVFPRGSGTGLSGGAIPLGGIALVMTRMNRILEIDPRDMLARVQPGVLTADFKRAVEAERFQVTLVVFGHAGDGNFHPDLICDERDPEEMRRVAQAIDAIFEAALRHGGTLSGEHGIGLLKRPYMTTAFDVPTLRAMRALKQAFDPDNLLNPGKLLPPVDGAEERSA